MSDNSIHVVTHEEGWALKREGENAPISTFDTQKEAVASAQSLAEKEAIDVIVHRKDGRFKEFLNYQADDESNTSENNMGSKTVVGTKEVHAKDLVSVGTRISWSAILAGVVISLVLQSGLMLLGGALGATFRNSFSDELMMNMGILWAVIGMVISMFMGGFVAATSVAGEDSREAMKHGVLVWGTVFILLPILLGSTLDYGFGNRSGLLMQQVNNTSLEDNAKEANLEVMRYVNSINATEASWWTVAGFLISLVAAIGGSIIGAGPELRIQTRRVNVEPAQA